MIRVAIGAVAAAVAMFIIGFLFFATPLGNIPVGQIDDESAAAVQQALAEHMGAEGPAAYVVPGVVGEAQQIQYINGPIAMVHYNPNGFALGDTNAMLGGFIQLLVSALLLGIALYGLSGHVRTFSERLKILIFFALAASVFMHLGNPVWWHQSWVFHGYLFVADLVSFTVGGAIITRWFLPKHVDSEDGIGERG
jgi:hypothetical protein